MEQDPGAKITRAPPSPGARLHRRLLRRSGRWHRARATLVARQRQGSMGRSPSPAAGVRAVVEQLAQRSRRAAGCGDSRRARVYSSPAVWGGRVSSARTRFTALRGERLRLWEVGTGGAISGAAVVVDGVAYAGNFADRILGVDARRAVLMRFKHGSTPPSPATDAAAFTASPSALPVQPTVRHHGRQPVTRSPLSITDTRGRRGDAGPAPAAPPRAVAAVRCSRPPPRPRRSLMTLRAHAPGSRAEGALARRRTRCGTGAT